MNTYKGIFSEFRILWSSFTVPFPIHIQLHSSPNPRAAFLLSLLSTSNPIKREIGYRYNVVIPQLTGHRRAVTLSSFTHVNFRNVFIWGHMSRLIWWWNGSTWKGTIISNTILILVQWMLICSQISVISETFWNCSADILKQYSCIVLFIPANNLINSLNSLNWITTRPCINYESHLSRCISTFSSHTIFTVNSIKRGRINLERILIQRSALTHL